MYVMPATRPDLGISVNIFFLFKDLDWAGSEDRKSTSGYIFTVFGILEE